jgi:hypothetical protein
MATKDLRRAIKQLNISDADPFLLIAWREHGALEAATVRLDPAMVKPLRDIWWCKDLARATWAYDNSRKMVVSISHVRGRGFESPHLHH